MKFNLCQKNLSLKNFIFCFYPKHSHTFLNGCGQIPSSLKTSDVLQAFLVYPQFTFYCCYHEIDWPNKELLTFDWAITYIDLMKIDLGEFEASIHACESLIQSVFHFSGVSSPGG